MKKMFDTTGLNKEQLRLLIRQIDDFINITASIEYTDISSATDDLYTKLYEERHRVCNKIREAGIREPG